MWPDWMCAPRPRWRCRSSPWASSARSGSWPSPTGGVGFTYFTVGAVLIVLGNLVPAVLGLTVPTYIASRIVTLLGAAFAGEAIMKTWAQESFPTLLRTTAQGSVIAVARLLAALVAGFTPLVIAAGTSILFSLLTAASLVGVATAWVVFRRLDGRSEFRMDPAARPARESAGLA